VDEDLPPRWVHVLVVEDDDDSREALRRTLKHCGALVTTAGTVNEAHPPRASSTARLGD
jgi:CheY-like chemotaxis protein